ATPRFPYTTLFRSQLLEPSRLAPWCMLPFGRIPIHRHNLELDNESETTLASILHKDLHHLQLIAPTCREVNALVKKFCLSQSVKHSHIVFLSFRFLFLLCCLFQTI